MFIDDFQHAVTGQHPVLAQGAIAARGADESRVDTGIADGGDPRVGEHPAQHLHLPVKQAFPAIQQGLDLGQGLRLAQEGLGGRAVMRRAPPSAMPGVDPGLKVVAPYDAADAKGLLKAAIRDPNPVVFLEHEMMYGLEFDVPEVEDYVLPIGKAKVRREGKDVTITAHSRMVGLALKAAEELAAEAAEAPRVVPESQAQLQLSFAPVVRSVTPSVVNVYATTITQESASPFARSCSSFASGTSGSLSRVPTNPSTGSVARFAVWSSKPS